MRRRFVALFAFLVLAGAGQALVFAGPYWVVENQSNQVFKVDVNTASATLVGATGNDFVFGGLGFAQGGTLYAWNTNPANLYTVNQLTGAMTLVGAGSTFGADTFDINPLTNQAIAWSVDGSLNEVNLATGATTFLANTAPGTPGIASAFGPDGTYYQLDFSNVLNKVDTSTGAVTAIGPLGVAGFQTTNLGFNPDDGFLYSIKIQDALYPLYRINPLTGAATFVGNVTGLPNDSSQQITAGTFQIAGNGEVPEPATLSLFGLGMVAVGACRYRRRNA
jgi:hypothetical protein